MSKLEDFFRNKLNVRQWRRDRREKTLHERNVGRLWRILGLGRLSNFLNRIKEKFHVDERRYVPGPNNYGLPSDYNDGGYRFKGLMIGMVIIGVLVVFVMGTQAVKEQREGNATVEQITIGSTVGVLNLERINMRKSPGHLNKPADDILCAIYQGDPNKVLSGPVFEDGLRWWKIKSSCGEPIGWVAEASPAGVLYLSKL